MKILFAVFNVEGKKKLEIKVYAAFGDFMLYSFFFGFEILF